MYQDSQTSIPNLIPFIPDAKIVLADRNMNTTDANFGKGYELDAETISNRLRSGYLNGLNYDAVKKQIASVVSAVKEAAAESDNDELLEFLTDLANILHITLTKSYRIALTFSVDAEIELPLGSDESEVDADDFSIYLEYGKYDAELVDWEMTEAQLDYIHSSN